MRNQRHQKKIIGKRKSCVIFLFSNLFSNFTGSTDFNSIQQQHTIQPDQVQNTANANMNVAYTMMRDQQVELVSKELSHLAAILHVYAGGLNFMQYFFFLFFFIIFQKENGNTFTLSLIFIVKSLQKQQNSTNLIL